MKTPLKTKIQKTKERLQANDKQMARYLRVSLADYKAIESGARVLPFPAQKSLEKRMEGLLDTCGISTEQLKQK